MAPDEMTMVARPKVVSPCTEVGAGRRFEGKRADDLPARNSNRVVCCSAAIFRNAATQDLEDCRRIGDVCRALWIAFQRSANHRHIGVRREPSRWYAHAQSRTVDAARPRAELSPDHHRDRHRSRCVFRRAARQRVDLAVTKLVTRPRNLFELKVLLERVSMARCRRVGVHGRNHNR